MHRRSRHVLHHLHILQHAIDNERKSSYARVVPQRLSRFYAHQQRIEDEKKLEAIILEGEDVENEVGMPLRRSADGHNRDRARGIPIVGRAGGGGASPGTDPVAALMRKDGGRRR
jgi:hypothetical protein